MSTIERLRQALEAYESATNGQQEERGLRALMNAATPDDLRELLALLDAAQRDAERYRWLRNEAWGGHVQKGGFVHAVEFRAGLMPSSVTELAEEALDASVDAGITAISARASTAGDSL